MADHSFFIKWWKLVKKLGFVKFLIATSCIWTIPFVIRRYLDSGFNTSLLRDMLSFWFTGASLAICLWIIGNYLYAKWTDTFTVHDHDHNHE